MNEIWKDIPEYENLYQISNYGNIRRIFKKGIKKLKPSEDKDGYYYVKLCKNNKQKHKRVNRLVMITFNNISNCENMQVNHIDGNKHNNSISNLEWCSQLQNLEHAFKNNLIITRKVICLETKEVYKSIREAGRKTNSNFRRIVECCQGKRKSTNNLHWEYYDYKEDNSL
jgi:hypothetical protein